MPNFTKCSMPIAYGRGSVLDISLFQRYTTQQSCMSTIMQEPFNLSLRYLCIGWMSLLSYSCFFRHPTPRLESTPCFSPWTSVDLFDSQLWNLSFPQITQTLFFFRSASTDYYPDHTFWAISVYVLLVVFVFLLARRCANAGRPTSYGPVSVSVTNQCSIKTVKRIGLFLARKLPSTYITLCFKEIQVPSKIRALPSGTLLQTRSGL